MEEYTEYNQWDSMPIFADKITDHNLNLLRGIVAHGFETPSAIQAKVVYPMACGVDIIANANSGTGKTGAFTIGSLSQIDTSIQKTQVVVISPTHELANQTFAVIKSIGQYIPATLELCIGKSVSVEENKYNLRKGRHIIVATPGRLLQLIKDRSFDMSAVRTIVLDEADRLLAGEFAGDIGGILKIFKDASKARVQVAIFSATMSDGTFDSIKPYITDPFSVVLEKEQLTLEGINQYYYEINSGESRDRQLEEKATIIEVIHSVKQISQSIIYVNGIESCRRLHALLDRRGLQSAMIHGQLSHGERERTIRDFRECNPRILISTDLLARGFNSQHMSLVINAEIPQVTSKHSPDVDPVLVAEYLHRIGRSGRYGRRGVAINLVGNPKEKFCLKIIEEFYGKAILPLPDDLEKVL